MNCWENFTRVERALGINSLFDAVCKGKLSRGPTTLKLSDPILANPMFGRNTSAQVHNQVVDERVDIIRIGLRGHNHVVVNIAITCMTKSIDSCASKGTLNRRIRLMQELSDL